MFLAMDEIGCSHGLGGARRHEALVLGDFFRYFFADGVVSGRTF